VIGLAYLLGGLLVLSLGLNAWLTYGRIKDAESKADSRVAQVATEAHQERTAYELEVTQKALTAANMRAATLEEELKHALEQPSLADGLDAHDVAGRVLRLVGKWGEAAAARSPLPAEPDSEAVPDEPAAEASGPVVHPE
jgi:hypothetical protein